MRLAALLLLIAATTAHAQWEIEDSHTTASLRGIHNVGGGIAWASGTGGTVLRTLDDGKTWQTCPIPLAETKDAAEKLDFRGIQAFDQNSAIVMSSGPGDQSRLYKTTDGCQTWKLLFTNPDKEGFWDSLVFDLRKPSMPDTRWSSLRNGVLIGDPVNGNYAIYTSHDSGDTWQVWAADYQKNDEIHRPAKARQGESLFAASNSSAIAPGINGPFAFVTGGTGGSDLITAEPHSPFDNGTTWKFRATTLPFKKGQRAGAFSIAARKPDPFQDMMIVGGDYSKPDDPGTAVFIPNRAPIVNMFSNPAVRSTHPPHGYRSAVAYDSTTKTWITVGPNGTDISTDDGRNWRPLMPTAQDAPDADKNWNALSLPFVVGPKGRIGKLRANTLK